jgi:hypothetical protein
MDDAYDADPVPDRSFEDFRARVWALERLSARHGGFLKVAPAKPTRLTAYAAKMYRAASRMSFVDMPNAVPLPGECCAFNAQQWARMPLWDVYATLKACRGRLVLIAIVGDSRQESEQTLVMDAVEIGRILI